MTPPGATGSDGHEHGAAPRHEHGATATPQARDHTRATNMGPPPRHEHSGRHEHRTTAAPRTWHRLHATNTGPPSGSKFQRPRPRSPRRRHPPSTAGAPRGRPRRATGNRAPEPPGATRSHAQRVARAWRGWRGWRAWRGHRVAGGEPGGVRVGALDGRKPSGCHGALLCDGRHASRRAILTPASELPRVPQPDCPRKPGLNREKTSPTRPQRHLNPRGPCLRRVKTCWASTTRPRRAIASEGVVAGRADVFLFWGTSEPFQRWPPCGCAGRPER